MLSVDAFPAAEPILPLPVGQQHQVLRVRRRARPPGRPSRLAVDRERLLRACVRACRGGSGHVSLHRRKGERSRCQNLQQGAPQQVQVCVLSSTASGFLLPRPLLCSSSFLVDDIMMICTVV